MIPFTVDQFLDVFSAYNRTVWPAQLVLYTLGLSAVLLHVKPFANSERIINFILSSLWLWMAIVYHAWFFSAINPAALLFAAMFIVQAGIFFWEGVSGPRLPSKFRSGTWNLIGLVLVAYALVGYQLLGTWIGHQYPAAPTFGVPCPTVIFTFGLIVASSARIPSYVLAIPLVWSAIGLWAALSLGMLEDLGLLVAGLVGLLMLLARFKRPASIRKLYPGASVERPGSRTRRSY